MGNAELRNASAHCHLPKVPLSYTPSPRDAPPQPRAVPSRLYGCIWTSVATVSTVPQTHLRCHIQQRCSLRCYLAVWRGPPQQVKKKPCTLKNKVTHTAAAHSAPNQSQGSAAFRSPQVRLWGPAQWAGGQAAGLPYYLLQMSAHLEAPQGPRNLPAVTRDTPEPR